MTIKCKYADIKQIYDWCDKFADDKIKELKGKQLSIHEIAYYTPSQANWSYIIGLVIVNGVDYQVVTVFGEIKAAMPANIPRYQIDGEAKTRI